MILVWLMLSALVLVGAVWTWHRTRRAYTSEIFEGLTPGLLPAPGTDAARLPLVDGFKGEIAVAFNPPRGVRPGSAGMLVFGSARTRDVIATIVDLAVRGFLTITVVEDPEARSGRDWELRRCAPPPRIPVEPGEKELLDQLFDDGPEVRLSKLADQGNTAVSDHRKALSRELDERGWGRTIAFTPATWPLWTGAGGLFVCGLVGSSLIPIVAAILTLFVAADVVRRKNERPLLSAEGTATQIQLLAFEKYLATAEKEQFSYEEAAGIFSRYLPYAISLGVAEHWTKVFGDLAAQARMDGYGGSFGLPWLSVDGWGVDGTGVDLGDVSSFGDLDGGGPVDLADALDGGAIDGVGNMDGGFGGDGGGFGGDGGGGFGGGGDGGG
ncbi:MAG TPA: DUF2207 domain-containing protein [Arachnia sp.]|nr:DUF2207 domain-containing protein [Arachnia sp.]HMT87934.1 DUF2207 domain-containing protein [Arachnia sp.]